MFFFFRVLSRKRSDPLGLNCDDFFRTIVDSFVGTSCIFVAFAAAFAIAEFRRADAAAGGGSSSGDEGRKVDHLAGRKVGGIPERIDARRDARGQTKSAAQEVDTHG